MTKPSCCLLLPKLMFCDHHKADTETEGSIRTNKGTILRNTYHSMVLYLPYIHFFLTVYCIAHSPNSPFPLCILTLRNLGLGIWTFSIGSLGFQSVNCSLIHILCVNVVLAYEVFEPLNPFLEVNLIGRGLNFNCNSDSDLTVNSIK